MECAVQAHSAQQESSLRNPKNQAQLTRLLLCYLLHASQGEMHGGLVFHGLKLGFHIEGPVVVMTLLAMSLRWRRWWQ
jgi:hypothetical protein